MDLADRLKVSSQKSWAAWGILVLLWVAFAYIWLLPLVSPRGFYLWGHYRLSDVFIGLPLALATLCATVIMFTPARLRQRVAVRVITLGVAVLFIVFAADAVYTFGLLKIWQPNMCFDLGRVTRQHNIADDELCFRRKPNLVWAGNPAQKTVDFRSDENGFRNPPGITKADIVFIGDSYTEAPQVPEETTFAQVVGKETGRSVVNLGISAYGPQQGLVVLKRYGFNYQPDVVVWGIFEGNDLGDAQSYALFRENPDRAFVSLKDRYLHNSLINQVFSLTMPPRPHPGSAPATVRYTDGTTKDVRLIYQAAMDQTEKKAKGLAETLKSIQTAHELCEAEGVQLVVVFFPAMIRVMAPYITFANQSDHDRFLPGDVVQHDEDFGTHVKGLAQSLGITFIDGFEVLKERAQKDNRGLFIRSDEHFDIEGHRIIAAEVVKALNAPSSVGP